MWHFNRRRVRKLAVAVRPVDALFRMLLVLSLWHAPLPWFHQHEISGAQVVREVGLLKHVDEFHADETERGETRVGWHTHLILPWSLSHHAPCPLDHSGDSSENFGAACKYAVASADSQFAPVASLAAAPFDGLIDFGLCHASHGMLHAPDTASTAQNGAGHFLATYGSAVSIRDLISVCVC